ncbi:hypothetical protein NDU88_000160, partial [Pleurodeles waltl]
STHHQPAPTHLPVSPPPARSNTPASQPTTSQVQHACESAHHQPGPTRLRVSPPPA